MTMLLLGAFLVRLGTRVAFGESYFWTNSYGFYYDLAENLVAGKGLCLDTTCAWRPPLYPLLLTLSALSGKNYLLVVVPQALIGTGMVLCAFLIGRQIFNARVGIIAAAITAFYPYYVMHDTALQETGLTTFCTALSVWLLVRAQDFDRYVDWFQAGLALGSTVLVRASAASVVVVSLIWAMIWGAQGNVWERLSKSSVLLLAAVIIVGPWIIRNYNLMGAPVLSSELGHALWVGNNSETFSYYPAQSIDRSEDAALSNLTRSDQAELAELAKDEVATSNWFARRAFKFIRASPRLIAWGVLRKIEAGFSLRLNPLRDRFTETLYAMSYAHVTVLGIIGMFLVRQRSEVILFGMLFLAFICVTAVFWAHTSHRSYLDLYWIIFAASIIERIWMQRQRLSTGY